MLILLFFLSSQLAVFSSNFKGYISNESLLPLKLKVFSLDKSSRFLLEKNLEDNSFVPITNLKITAFSTEDYFLPENTNSIPASTKFLGQISQIDPPKNFNRRGLYKVTFDKAICPDGKITNLENSIISKSEDTIYEPFGHIGKTLSNIAGGSLGGALASYEFGGLGLALATQGYSLGVGALAGSFVGIVNGITGKGKNASIKPGDELFITPEDEMSLKKLAQINCNMTIADYKPQLGDIKLTILKVKQKKDLLGDVLRIDISFKNNSQESYRLSNFVLDDSQGNEYTASVINLNEDILKDFPPNETRNTTLEFFIDYPEALHWLVLKDNNFNKELARLQIKE